MASMRDIKRRKSSIQSTGQITKAMKLVATVKLQKARGKAEQTKPYSDCMYRTVQSILERTQTADGRYLMDVLACYGISAEEFSEVYRKKAERNLTRWAK